MTSDLQCPRCHVPLDGSFLNRGSLSPCSGCGVPLEVEAFPALFRPVPRGSEGEPLMVDGEASCFYHPQKKALVPCQGCGRFLCALCDCQLQDHHYCPSCLETGKQKGKIKNLENQRTLYDSVALSLAVYPLIIFYFTLFTAPLALYVALRYWNAPRSIIRRSRLRYILAIVFASLQLVGWAVFIYSIVSTAKTHG